MAQNLPDFPSFNINEEPNSLAVQWNKWMDRFENLLKALAVGEDEDGRKKALLLYYAGKDVHEIYQTLSPSADETFSRQNKSSRLSSSRHVTRLLKYLISEL